MTRARTELALFAGLALVVMLAAEGARAWIQTPAGAPETGALESPVFPESEILRDPPGIADCVVPGSETAPEPTPADGFAPKGGGPTSADIQFRMRGEGFTLRTNLAQVWSPRSTSPRRTEPRLTSSGITSSGEASSPDETRAAREALRHAKFRRLIRSLGAPEFRAPPRGDTLPTLRLLREDPGGAPSEPMRG